MEIDLTTSYVGILSLIVFVLAYAVVMAEEFSHLRKSKPVIISAAVIWGIIAFHFSSDKQYAKEIEYALEHNICLLYTSPSPRDPIGSRMPSSA